jgi:hypothetical protein
MGTTRSPILFALFLLVAAPCAAESSDGLAPFGWLRQLVGACWKGERPDGIATDTQCYEAQFAHFLRGTIEIHAGETDKLRGDSVWGWDPKRQRMMLTTWASTGTISSSEAYFEGDVIRFPLLRREGSIAPETRRSWRRIDADSFSVQVERNEAGEWREMERVIYRRSGTAAR